MINRAENQQHTGGLSLLNKRGRRLTDFKRTATTESLEHCWMLKCDVIARRAKRMEKGREKR